MHSPQVLSGNYLGCLLACVCHHGISFTSMSNLNVNFNKFIFGTFYTKMGLVDFIL